MDTFLLYSIFKILVAIAQFQFGYLTQHAAHNVVEKIYNTTEETISKV